MVEVVPSPEPRLLQTLADLQAGKLELTHGPFPKKLAHQLLEPKFEGVVNGITFAGGDVSHVAINLDALTAETLGTLIYMSIPGNNPEDRRYPFVVKQTIENNEPYELNFKSGERIKTEVMKDGQVRVAQEDGSTGSIKAVVDLNTDDAAEIRQVDLEAVYTSLVKHMGEIPHASVLSIAEAFNGAGFDCFRFENREWNFYPEKLRSGLEKHCMLPEYVYEVAVGLYGNDKTQDVNMSNLLNRIKEFQEFVLPGQSKGPNIVHLQQLFGYLVESSSFLYSSGKANSRMEVMGQILTTFTRGNNARRGILNTILVEMFAYQYGYFVKSSEVSKNLRTIFVQQFHHWKPIVEQLNPPE